MVRCPDCDTEIDVDEDEVEEGEIFELPGMRCRARSHAGPSRPLIVLSDEEDEDEEEVKADDDDDEEERKRRPRRIIERRSGIASIRLRLLASLLIPFFADAFFICS